MKKIFFMFVFVVGIFSSAEAFWPFSSSVPYVTEEKTLSRQVEEIVRKIWGAENNWQEAQPRVISISEISQADKNLALELRLRLDDANTGSMVKINLLDHCKAIMEKIFSDEQFIGYNEVRIYGILLLEDKYGKTFEESVCKLFMTKDLAQKIAWDKIDFLRFQEILETDGTYWIHNAIEKDARF